MSTLRSEGRPREEGSSVTTLYIGSYKGYTTAHMAYLEVA